MFNSNHERITTILSSETAYILKTINVENPPMRDQIKFSFPFGDIHFSF